MKNIKWTAQELLDMFNKETNFEEFRELWKAIIAFELGATQIDNEILEKVIDYYYNKDYMTSIINEELLDYANQLLDIN